MKQIVIAQRGWVFVGDVERDGDDVTIAGAQCIRRWGTTKGLGELAANGPQRGTVLDPMGTVRRVELAAKHQAQACDCPACVLRRSLTTLLSGGNDQPSEAGTPAGTTH